MAPRSSGHGHLKIVLEFAEGVDTYDMTGDLVQLVQSMREATGVYLHLD